jgi:signal transduction histidine kinase
MGTPTEQMAREALSNAARHSRASHVHVRLSVQEDTLVLDITDDGRGFDPERARSSGHLGLTNLADRATANGGEVDVDSTEGRGTRVLIRLPLAVAQPVPA